MYFSDELSYVRTRLNAHEGKRLMGRLLNTCVFCNGDKIGPIVGFIFNFGYTNPAIAHPWWRKCTGGQRFSTRKQLDERISRAYSRHLVAVLLEFKAGDAGSE